MKKYLLAIGLALILVLAAPVATRAESLNVAQLHAIIASLQAQLNFLIAKLQLQLQQQNGSTTTSSNQLTADKILNSNGFVNGKKQVGQYSSSDLSGIIFGQLDNDSGQEAIAVQTNCGASCGKEIVAFKLVNNTVLMVSLPDSAVSGAAQNIDVMKIGSDGLITVTGTDNFGSKTNYYRVTLVNGILKAEKTSYQSSQSSIIVTSPNGGEIVKNSPDKLYIKWTSSDNLKMSNSNIYLYPDPSMPQCGQGYVKIFSNQSNSNGSTMLFGSDLNALSKGNICRYKVEVIDNSDTSIKDLSDNYFTFDPSSTPTLKATLNVTALNGAIQCFRAPCEFPLSKATVMLYNSDKESKLIATQVAINGVATFTNLDPGTYYAVVNYPGYSSSDYVKVGLVSGQSASVKIPVFLAR